MIRRAGLIALLAFVSGCTSTPPIVAPSARVAPPATTPAPNVSDAASSEPASLPTPTGTSLALRCSGVSIRSTTIDYADEAPGATDIVAATRQLRGVVVTDVVVRDGISTFVIRDGRVIWRGDWVNLGDGFLLGQSTGCSDVRIGL